MERKPKPLLKVCPHCDGRGWLEITGVYAETWRLLKEHGPISGVALSQFGKCEPTAMNNRLATLEELGLAKSERYGRLRLFAAIEQ